MSDLASGAEPGSDVSAEGTLQESGSSPALRRVAVVMVVLLAALMVRFHAATRAPNIARDGAIYLQIAHLLGQGDCRTAICSFHYHPGYPAMIAAVAKLTGASWPEGWIQVGRGVSTAMGLLALVMLYLFARRAFDPACALVAILFFGLAEPFTEVSSDVLSDAPAVALAMCAIVLGFRARETVVRGRWTGVAWAAFAGLAAGLGYLCRPEALLSAGLVGLLLIVRGLPVRARGLQIACLLALAACTLACVLPYAMSIGGLTQKKSFSDFTWAGGGSAMLAQASWAADLPRAFGRTLDRARSIMGTPMFVLAAVCWLTWTAQYLLRLPLPDRLRKTVPAPAGLVMAVGTGVIVVLLTAMEMKTPGYISSRHALLAVFLLAPCAGAGFFLLIEYTRMGLERLAARNAVPFKAWFDTRSLARRLAGHPEFALWFWLAVFLVAVGVNALDIPHKDKGCYRRIGQEVRRLFGPGQRVLAPDSWPLLFADAPVEQFTITAARMEGRDMASPDALYRRATDGGFRLVVLSSRMMDFIHNHAIADQVLRDKRFCLLATRESLDQAWLFYVRPQEDQETSTKPKTQSPRQTTSTES